LFKIFLFDFTALSASHRQSVHLLDISFSHFFLLIFRFIHQITKKFDWTFLDTVRNALLHDAAMSVTGSLTVRIGQSFVMTMLWDAERVPTTLVL
jgi:hypothetical protein